MKRERPHQQPKLYELRKLIVENPERSAKLAGLAGFAWGGGLSNWTAFRLTFAALETLIGDRIVTTITPGKEPNDRRRN
jgi:hypothetical protein